MRRGEIRVVDLDPVLGADASKVRPAVIVSNNGANVAAERPGNGVLTVVPVTPNITRVYPFQVLLPAARCGLPQNSKAQAEQVRSVAAVESVGVSVYCHPVCWTGSTQRCGCTSVSDRGGTMAEAHLLPVRLSRGRCPLSARPAG